jgi:hypothetical protein
MQPLSPRDEYQRRLAATRLLAAQQARRHSAIANARLAVFLAGLLGLALGFWTAWFSLWWTLVPALVFGILVALHERAAQARLRAERAASYYERGMARLEHRWAGLGEAGERYADPEHPYALDLDIFGKGSLFQLLCTARTRSGEDTLAAWLKAPAAAEEIRARQAAVEDLRPRLQLREDLGVLGTEVRQVIHPNELAAWGNAPPQLHAAGARIVLELLSLLAVATLAGWFAFDFGPIPFVIACIVEGSFALWYARRVRAVIATIDRTTSDLMLLGAILGRLEQEPFNAPKLRQLRAALDTDGLAPSRRIAQLANLLGWLDARRNQLFLPIALLLLWTTRLAFAIDAWRAISGPAIARWLAVVGEFEALAALATFAYENPADPFPEVVAEGPCYQGEELGHPLLPRNECVRNDVLLGAEPRILLVSGSNMSGKSTLLRTVGINAVLALAGAPVPAKRLRLSLLAVGATLRIQDSLQAGRSRFYAELLRVRQIVDLARGPLPLLFLLDEIFHGTNSHDRRHGAAAVVKGLMDRGAIGLVTTHDLALAEIATQLGPLARNVHFADHLENGTMVFDYRMQPGIVQHSNAIALMRAVGLEV